MLPLKIILTLPLPNAFNVESLDIWKRIAIPGPKQVLQYLRLRVTVEHPDCVLGAKKAIIRLINADQNFIKTVPLYNWKMANGASPRPHKQWGRTLWGPPAHLSACLQPLSHYQQKCWVGPPNQNNCSDQWIRSPGSNPYWDPRLHSTRDCRTHSGPYC